MCFKKHINRVVEIVTLLENQNPIEVYDEMDLDSEKDGIYYERLCLFGGSITILNGAFPIYIAERYNTFNMWIMAAQILSLVPGEHDAFLKAHNTIKSIYTKSSVEKINALSVLRIEQTRYASNDTQSTDAYTQMKNSTNDAIAAVRQF